MNILKSNVLLLLVFLPKFVFNKDRISDHEILLQINVPADVRNARRKNSKMIISTVIDSFHRDVIKL